MAESTLHMTPLELLSRLPADRPAYMLHSGERAAPFSRYSIIAIPRAVYRFTDHSEFFLLPGEDETMTERKLRQAARRFTHDPMRDLESMLSWTRVHSGHQVTQPFPCGWIGMFAYELGALIEPAAGRRGSDTRPAAWPMIELGWCPHPLVYDHTSGEWIRGTEMLRAENPVLKFETSDGEVVHRWRAGALSPSVPRQAHIERVARTIDHIRAGDIFQANITQQFTAPFDGSTRRFARAALEASGAWYGAMLELTDGRTVVSMSPELFLDADHHRQTVMTRPIKGTLPRNADPRTLEESEKDKAELAMIVDLMRNDLGRVCEIGSIRVTNPRKIETHGAVHQGVGEVRGEIGLHVTPSDLLRATFPPGSVTGAPKIRAMQIIEELEASSRGPYCGAIGFLSGHGRTMLSVGIRTVAITGTRPEGRFDMLAGTLSYGAGGGIVVDSDPEQEWEEALAKTQLLRTLIGGS